MKAESLDLSLVSTTEPDWFHVLDEVTEAVKFKLKAIDNHGSWEIFERTELGFCYRGRCVGSRPGDAFTDYAKKVNAPFTVNIKISF